MVERGRRDVYFSGLSVRNGGVSRVLLRSSVGSRLVCLRLFFDGARV